MPEKIALIDGHSLVHRAFFALPPLTNAKGQPTGAVYGFLTMLLKLMEDEKPTHLAVAFDRSGPTFRHTEFKEYKAQRPEMPDDLRSQIGLLRQVLTALDIPIYELDRYEADDLLGTMAGRARREGFEALIVTGDRDALQLVEPGVTTVLTRKGITDLERYDVERIRERYGVEPLQLIDVKGLMGDTSDNIPGVPGVGEKTALKLIQQYGSLEGVYEHIDEVGGKKLPENLRKYQHQAELSRQLATIETDAPIETDFEACRRRSPDPEKVVALFNELGFRTLLERLGLNTAERQEAGEEVEVAIYQASGEKDGETELAEVLTAERVALALEWAGAHPPRPAALAAAATAGEAQFLGLLPEAGSTDQAATADRILKNLLLNKGEGRVVVHDLKPLLQRLTALGEATGDLSRLVEERAFDTLLAAYLLDPTRSAYPVEDLAGAYLNLSLPGRETLFGSGRQAKSLGEITPEELAQHLGRQAAALWRLEEALGAELEARDMHRLYYEVELPLAAILAEMEQSGILVDPRTLEELGGEFAGRIAELTAEIYELAGEEFNINSTQQLGQILFEKLKLPVVKKTKTGYSTDAEVLEQLAAEHPLPEKLLEYRQLVKLQSTYIVGLKEVIHPETGRIHTTFNQTIAATGRLSSTDPNLQNIPIREDVGRQLRRAFVAPEGHLLLACDYSQIELRVLAHISGDEGLLGAFRAGQDIHTATAAEVFGVAPAEVTPAMRSQAKAVNFGIVYGISDFGLARGTGMSRKEARKFIDTYFERYSGVHRYIKRIVAEAHEKGFVTTLLKRVRPLPELRSRNFARRQFAERTAMNTPIQGSAADIIKLAMIRAHRTLRQEGFKTRMLLQVHDELIFEVPREELGAVKERVVAAMEGAYELDVPLKVDVKAGSNWYEMDKEEGQ